MISVVIRAHNEAKWLGRCLYALSKQRLNIDDVILVDNESTDDTRDIGEAYGVRLISIPRDDFTFGRALNIGIGAARHEAVSILSAHCIPVDELWGDYIHVHLGKGSQQKICGVYGRQEPLPETSAMDARDLWTTFREERQIQESDYFFHNANSAVRKSLWHDNPFDEEINGVEDRAWGKVMIGLGYQILYEPHARVYHHHGIHQGRNETRARRVAAAIRYIHTQV